jgi:hypothetical protein
MHNVVNIYFAGKHSALVLVYVASYFRMIHSSFFYSVLMLQSPKKVSCFNATPYNRSNFCNLYHLLRFLEIA